MVQLSKQDVDQKILKRITEIFLESILRLKNKKDATEFLETLLTRTEQLMLAKRFAIAVLLAKGYDYESIKHVLKVSQGTISSVKEDVVNSEEGYRKSIKRILKEEKIRKIFEVIDDLFDIVPPKGGDWSEWRKKKWEKQMERQKPL